MSGQRRTFNSRERQTLWLASGGVCGSCGRRLERGWHADHVTPYSKGGETDVVNGQALCGPCNRRKGDAMGEDSIKLRRFQREFVRAAVDKARAGKHSMVANVHPGSGKTIAALHAANELYREGYIDAVQYFAPRINLCQQLELDWKGVRDLYAHPRMSKISHRENVTPLLRGGDFGYVSTNASLVAAKREPVTQETIHTQLARGKRVLLIADEAQGLATDEHRGSTRSAEVIEELSELAAFTIVMSGTPYRADGRKLLHADYSDTDEAGYQYLEADVEASYIDGVSEGYLRQFEATLSDGYAVHEYMTSGETETTMLSAPEGKISRVLRHPDFWAELVDMTVEQVHEMQSTVDPRLAGLVAAYDQEQAKAIKAYVERRHPGTKALIAVSEDNEYAQDSLRKFKRGGYDILITVRMAYVGYDHKPISVVCVLTNFRASGFLRQLFARGMRMMDDIPAHEQILRVIVPDDPKMAEVVEQLRHESEQGVKERNQRREAERENAKNSFNQEPFGETVDAWLIGSRAQGMDPGGDVDHGEYDTIRGWQQEYPLGAVNPTGLAKFLRDQGVKIDQSGGSTATATARGAPSDRTEREELLSMRAKLDSELKSLTGKLMSAGIVPKDDWGHHWRELYAEFGHKKPESLDANELRTRLRWVEETYRSRVHEWISR